MTSVKRRYIVDRGNTRDPDNMDKQALNPIWGATRTYPPSMERVQEEKESKRNGKWTRKENGGMSGWMSHLPRLGVDVEHVTLLHVELEEATRNLRDTRFELEVGDVLVIGQVEVFPRLGLLDLLTPDGLGDLLLLLDSIEDITITVCIAFSMCAAGVEKDVVDGVDALHWAGDELVLGLLQTTDTGLALWCGWTDIDGALAPGFVGFETIGITVHVDTSRGDVVKEEEDWKKWKTRSAALCQV